MFKSYSLNLKDACYKYAPLFLTLIAFSLRLLLVDFQELRGDEAFGYFFSQHSYSAIIQNTFDLQEPHPVASYFVQKAWVAWAGDSEFALRFMSVWFSTLAVALLYRLTRNFKLDSYTSFIAMALMTISPYAIWHAQDARMYSMSLALTLASTVLAMRLVGNPKAAFSDKLLGAITYVIVSWLALHTHYFAAFVIIAQTLIVMAYIREPSRKNTISNTLATWLATQTLLMLLYLPWLIRAWPILTDYTGNGESPPLWAMVGRSLAVFAVGESAYQPMIWGTLAVAALMLGMLLNRQQDKRWAMLALSCYLWIPLSITWYSALSRPIFDERYLIAAAPPFYLLLSMAIRRVTTGPNKWMRSILLAFILFSGMLPSLHNYYMNPIYSKTRGWRELAATMDALSTALPADQVRLVQNYPDPTLWYYYRSPVPHLVLPPVSHDISAAQQEVAALIAADVQRVVLAQQIAPEWDGDAIARNELAQHYQLVLPIEIGPWQVETFVRPPQTWQPIEIFFENGVSLTHYALSPDEIVAGGQLVLHLKWGGDKNRLNGTEKVFIHLINAAGALVAQNDQPLGAISDAASPELIKEYGILIPDEVSGEYQILVGLYDPSQGGAPRILTTDGADFVRIDTLLQYDGKAVYQ